MIYEQNIQKIQSIKLSENINKNKKRDTSKNKSKQTSKTKKKKNIPGEHMNHMGKMSQTKKENDKNVEEQNEQKKKKKDKMDNLKVKNQMIHIEKENYNVNNVKIINNDITNEISDTTMNIIKQDRSHNAYIYIYIYKTNIQITKYS